MFILGEGLPIRSLTEVIKILNRQRSLCKYVFFSSADHENGETFEDGCSGDYSEINTYSALSMSPGGRLDLSCFHSTALRIRTEDFFLSATLPPHLLYIASESVEMIRFYDSLEMRRKG